ncbi:MBL fold metallo-hydrolase [Nocardia camponoti]|uniref:MBL fold metallo-hydrolase n=1 Tax=Nocardia camponoti TaxID=1616106 RepID=A0A917VBU9_9NOCA|nr:MBL fold metallo-hydrolase [Nocardia camponoti]GGK60745.1 MBL fold metallo-hydrolase [Nocardia camponoti]
MTLAHPAYGRVRPVTPTASVLLADNPGQMTLDGTNTWLLRGPDSDEFIVVDPGPKDKAHTAAIVEATGGRVALTLITHHHFDHTDGIKALVRATGTPVRAVERKYLHGDVAPLVDGEVIEAAGVRITVLATPGHTGDSVSFLLDDAILSGDTVLGRGTTVLENGPNALKNFLDSLETLIKVGAGKALLPAHGPDHPEAVPVFEYYLNHRRERLAQVKAALDELGNDAGAFAVVRKVYADVDKRLWPAARSSVQAQLEYLRAGH